MGERVLGASERLYFLHIPKTGGTSLFSWLRTRFDPCEVCPATEPERLLALPKGSLDRYRLLGWHYGLHVLRLFDAVPRIVTLLRDPLSRSISHYRDIQSRPDHPLHAAVRGWSFERFVVSPEGEGELLNLQCRFLALDDYEADFLGHRRLALGDTGALRAKYTDRALLERACLTLDSLDAYGLCERLDAAAGRIAAMMGWPPPGRMPHLNAVRSPFPAESLTGAVVERVRELTTLDQALYHRAARAAAGGAAIPSHIAS